MRFGLPVSILLHAALLLWAIVSIGSARPTVPPVDLPVQVELLTAAQFDDLRAGDERSKIKDIKPAAPAKPQPPAEVKEKPKRIAKQPPPPKTEPEPPAEPKKTEPKQADKQTPPPEPAPDPIAEQLRKAESEPLPPKDPPKQEPKKEAKKSPPVQTPAKKAPKKQKGVDVAKLQALIDRTPGAAPEPEAAPSEADPLQPKATASIGAKTATGTGLSVAEERMIFGIFSRKVQDCWTVLNGAAEGRDLIVHLTFSMTPDGRVEGNPKVTNSSNSPLFPIAAENAVRAVKACEPYALPPELYEQWRTWDIDFDPSTMFGG